MPSRWIAIALAAVASFVPCEGQKFDILVYGATPSGIMASIAAARMGERVALVEPSRWLGGVVSGGLCVSDVGDPRTIGGLAREFFNRIREYYAHKYGENSQQVRDCANGYRFEPHVATLIFETMLNEQKSITVFREHLLESVELNGIRIRYITTRNLRTSESIKFTADIFIDASYEGDLMAKAGVPYRIGREGRGEYGESLAGCRLKGYPLFGAGDHRVQAYNFRVCVTNRRENAIPFPKPPNYDPSRFVRLRERIKRKGCKSWADFWGRALKAWHLPNDKFDFNIADYVGANYAYVEGDWEARRRIAEMHRNNTLAALYFLQNDPDLPEEFLRDAKNWGLPKDEFTDNGNFPHQLYIREARRMLGRYALTQHDVLTYRHKRDSIAVASFAIDVHGVQRVLTERGWVGEGGMYVGVEPWEIPYRAITPHAPRNLLVTVCISATHIAYASLRMEPVYMMLGHAGGIAAHLARERGVSVQDVAVNELRKILREQGQILDAPFRPCVEFTWQPQRPQVGEPVKFKLIEHEVRAPLIHIWWDFNGDGVPDSTEREPTHTFKSEKVHTIGLVVEDADGNRSKVVQHFVQVGNGFTCDVTVDDAEAQFIGNWRPSSAIKGYFGVGYRTDDNERKGEKRVRFVPNLTRAGRYLVCIAYTPFPNRASNVPVIIKHRDGETKIIINQRERKTPFPFVPLGEFHLDVGKGNYVEIRNDDTDGYVIADAVRWIWVGE